MHGQLQHAGQHARPRRSRRPGRCDRPTQRRHEPGRRQPTDVQQHRRHGRPAKSHQSLQRRRDLRRQADEDHVGQHHGHEPHQSRSFACSPAIHHQASTDRLAHQHQRGEYRRPDMASSTLTSRQASRRIALVFAPRTRAASWRPGPLRQRSPRARFGSRKATTRASITPPSPRPSKAAVTTSRTSPSTRLASVPRLVAQKPRTNCRRMSPVHGRVW